ncbi:hypothetical protein AM593_03655, partial [Mytilus galloprovincialis]
MKSEDEASNENEVMLISDNTDSETDKCSKIKSKNCTQSNSNLNVSDQCMEISDSDSEKLNSNNSNSQEGSQLTNMESKPKLSKDIENVLMVDEMTSSDIKPLKTVDRPQLGKGLSQDGTDIVDLFCKEEDGNIFSSDATEPNLKWMILRICNFLMEQWDKENYNPDGSLMKEMEEILPRIDNESSLLTTSPTAQACIIAFRLGIMSVMCMILRRPVGSAVMIHMCLEQLKQIDIFDDLKDHYTIHANKKK